MKGWLALDPAQQRLAAEPLPGRPDALDVVRALGSR